MSAREQVVGFTDFTIGGWWAIGPNSRLSQVVFQERFVGPVRVLQEGDVVGARPMEGSHLVGRHPHEAECGAHLIEAGGVFCGSSAHIGV